MLHRCVSLADYADTIRLADTLDGDGHEEWTGVYDMAREAGSRMQEIRGILNEILHTESVVRATQH
jgi:hypothetical protein